MDEEIMHGATVYVEYEITVTNNGATTGNRIIIADYLDNEYADTVEKLVQEDNKHTDSGINPWI